MQFAAFALVSIVGVASTFAAVLPAEVSDVPVCSITVPPQPNFKPSSFYTGQWYVSGATPRPTPGTSCAYYNVTAGTGPLLFQQHIKILTKTIDSQGHITPDAANGGATATAHDDTLDIDLSLTVVDTDYDNYAIAVACGKKGIVVVQQALVVSRKPSKPDNLPALKQKIHDLGFATNAIIWGELDNNDC